MKDLFNGEKDLIIRIMNYEPAMSWIDLYDKMVESIPRYVKWLHSSAEEQCSTTKAIILLDVVRSFAFYDDTGVWSDGAYCDTRVELNRAITDLFLKGCLGHLYKSDLYGVVDDDLLEKYANLLKQ